MVRDQRLKRRILARIKKYLLKRNETRKEGKVTRIGNLRKITEGNREKPPPPPGAAFKGGAKNLGAQKNLGIKVGG